MPGLCKILFALNALALAAHLFGTPVVAQETLTIQSENGEPLTKRRGQIVDWRGDVIVLDSGSRQIDIDASTVIQLETEWPAGVLEARQLMNRRQMREALAHFEPAAKSERRVWARDMILAEQIQCLSAIEDYVAAAGRFMQIVENDPESRFFCLIPLAWDSISQLPQPELAKWIDSRNETAQLIGASWSLIGPTRKTAVETLEQLQQRAAPNIAMLAASQLWRIDAGPDQRAIDRWMTQTERMPKPLRAGPYYLIGNALANSGRIDDSLLHLMRLPILYPRSEPLAANALIRASALLKQTDRADQATTLLHEIQRDFPETTWSARAAELFVEKPPSIRDTDD
jgi:tetratricopeptide (TPR) repeat protein